MTTAKGATTGTADPTPVRLTRCGLPEALVAKASVALRVAAGASGSKRTVTVQEAPGVSVAAPQPSLTIPKWALSAPGDAGRR
ncbi:MAG: hypothetical protein U0232_09650 [Thermomicrobiales bacterium]